MGLTKLGFIGYGNMGSILLKSFLESETIAAEQVHIFARKREKLTPLKNQYPAVHSAESIKDVAEQVDILFICTSTYAVREIIEEITEFENIHIVLINGGIKTSSVEKLFAGKITRAIPTMTSEVFLGYTIVNHNDRVEPADREYINQLFEGIGDVVELDENQFSAGSDLTSCAPAIIAEMHKLYIQAICEKSAIPVKLAEKMFSSAVLGTAKLLEKSGESAQDLVDRVATKGGATEAAITVLRNELPRTFKGMVEATTNAYDNREKYTDKQFTDESI